MTFPTNPENLTSTWLSTALGIEVNGFRVEAAIAKLQDPAFDQLSVEGIGLESGFQSRSAMYAAFKKQTGYSPGHFRQ